MDYSIIKLIYCYFLIDREIDDPEDNHILTFLFEGAPRHNVRDFMLKYAVDGTILKIIANNCKKYKDDTYHINWNQVRKDIKA